MDNIKLYQPSNKTEATFSINKYISEIKRLQKLFGIEGKKQCSVCNENKSIEEFNSKQSKCRVCARAYFKTRYHERQKAKKNQPKQTKQE
jgi:hypothetical protein